MGSGFVGVADVIAVAGGDVLVTETGGEVGVGASMVDVVILVGLVTGGVIGWLEGNGVDGLPVQATNSDVRITRYIGLMTVPSTPFYMIT